MSIGTNLLHTLASKQFSKLDSDISGLQSQISSGQVDPRASVDPVRSLNISATNDQKVLLQQFTTNLESADNRLTHSDTVLEEVNNVLNRLSEIAIRGASASVAESERASLLIEAQELRDSLVDLAQARDSTGRALFGGYTVEADPFSAENGKVEYVGDTGRHSVRISETMMMASSLNGQEVFMEVGVDFNGNSERRDLFSLVDDLLVTLSPGGGNRRVTATAENELRLTPGASAGQVSMTIDGPNGSAEVSAPYMAASPDALLAAINAETATTGITASIDPDDPASLRLTATGVMTLSEVTLAGGGNAVAKQILVTPFDGGSEGDAIVLVPERFAAAYQISAIDDATGHIADKRAEIGSLQQVGQRQASALDNRQEMVERALAGFEGVDIAAAVTELQAMLLTRSAAQQTYSKISTKTLFDYIG